MSDSHEHHGLTVVHACGHDEEGQIVISFLASNGIKACLNTDLPHSVLPVASDVEVLVNEDNAAEAKRLLAERKD